LFINRATAVPKLRRLIKQKNNGLDVNLLQRLKIFHTGVKTLGDLALFYA
jgi:hypothetical protein